MISTDLILPDPTAGEDAGAPPFFLVAAFFGAAFLGAAFFFVALPFLGASDDGRTGSRSAAEGSCLRPTPLPAVVARLAFFGGWEGGSAAGNAPFRRCPERVRFSVRCSVDGRACSVNV